AHPKHWTTGFKGFERKATFVVNKAQMSIKMDTGSQEKCRLNANMQPD
ncbi:hypothetical protein AVEN_149615-1, partial [Araneus ventricosus]